jgi:hypothetical protein
VSRKAKATRPSAASRRRDEERLVGELRARIIHLEDAVAGYRDLLVNDGISRKDLCRVLAELHGVVEGAVKSKRIRRTIREGWLAIRLEPTTMLREVFRSDPLDILPEVAALRAILHGYKDGRA